MRNVSPSSYYFHVVEVASTMDTQNITEEEEDPFITELCKNRGSWRVKDRDPSRLLEFPRTATKWRLGSIFYERDLTMEPSAVCVATQVVGPNVGLKAIVKMRIKVSKRETTKTVDGLEGVPKVFSDEAVTALEALKHLTELGCTATPKLLDYKVEIQTKDDIAEGAYALYVLMERVPGRNLVHFGELSMAERNDARIAFGVAIREFYSYGYLHNDPHPRNIMWDPKSRKSYIIDLEDVTKRKSALRPAWIGDFYEWGLKGPSGWSSIDLDPMVAAFDFGLQMPDEAELRRVADETMEKGLGLVKDLEFLGQKQNTV